MSALTVPPTIIAQSVPAETTIEWHSGIADYFLQFVLERRKQLIEQLNGSWILGHGAVNITTSELLVITTRAQDVGVIAMIISAPWARSSGISLRAVTTGSMWARLAGRELTASSHSFSASPMIPILTPVDDVSIMDFCACPRGMSSPSAGSVTLASSQGKLH
ncbi:hypothetical protein KCU81_g92, partial [Aureobasidium melanogenum]